MKVTPFLLQGKASVHYKVLFGLIHDRLFRKNRRASIFVDGYFDPKEFDGDRPVDLLYAYEDTELPSDKGVALFSRKRGLQLAPGAFDAVILHFAKDNNYREYWKLIAPSGLLCVFQVIDRRAVQLRSPIDAKTPSVYDSVLGFFPNDAVVEYLVMLDHTMGVFAGDQGAPAEHGVIVYILRKDNRMPQETFE